MVLEDHLAIAMRRRNNAYPLFKLQMALLTDLMTAEKAVADCKKKIEELKTASAETADIEAVSAEQQRFTRLASSEAAHQLRRSGRRQSPRTSAAREGMIDMVKRHEIQVLRRAGHEQAEIARLTGVSAEASAACKVDYRSAASILKASVNGAA